MPAGLSVADVGTGDGLLAAYLAAQGRRVIAIENKPGPLAFARRRLGPLCVESRPGDGLGPIAPGEVDVAVIAGMGGRTIGRILASSPQVVAMLKALVLQPVQHCDELEEYLAREGYIRRAARETFQRGHRYSTLLVVPPYSTAI